MKTTEELMKDLLPWFRNQSGESIYEARQRLESLIATVRAETRKESHVRANEAVIRDVEEAAEVRKDFQWNQDAAAAMNGLLAGRGRSVTSADGPDIAVSAFNMADAMRTERENRKRVKP